MIGTKAVEAEEEAKGVKANPPSPRLSSLNWSLHLRILANPRLPYATVKDSIIQYIQKTFKERGHDVATSLHNMQKIDLSPEEPHRDLSSLADAAKKKIVQDGFDIKYQAKFTHYMDRCDALDNGLIKAYSLIFMNYCTKAMQIWIEEHPDFSSKIKNDPITLLEAIETLTHDPIWARYPFASMTEAITRLVNSPQYENENLLDYVKRFKQYRDVLKTHIGKKVFNDFVENTVEYHALSGNHMKEQAMKDATFEQWCVFLLIRNSDQNKYGSLVKGLISQYSMGNDQYPKTITAATNVLSNHRHDNRNCPKPHHGWSDHDTSSTEDTSEASTEMSFA